MQQQAIKKQICLFRNLIELDERENDNVDENDYNKYFWEQQL